MKREAFRDQVVIVTGASAGIGKALTLQLASQGAKVAIAARRAERLEQTAAECRSLGGEILALPTDVSNESRSDKSRQKRGCIDLGSLARFL